METDEERKRAEKMILKVEVEKILCEAVGDPMNGVKGYDLVAHLMCLDTHDFNKYIGQVLGKFEMEFEASRPEGWKDFSDKVSKLRFEDGKYFKGLSKKSQGLRDAALILATLADCFDYIEKADIK